MSTQHLRYLPAGTIPKEHELLPIWNNFNANAPSQYSTEKIVSEAATLQNAFQKDNFDAELIRWEQVPGKKHAWYDSVYGQCPRS